MAIHRCSPTNIPLSKRCHRQLPTQKRRKDSGLAKAVAVVSPQQEKEVAPVAKVLPAKASQCRKYSARQLPTRARRTLTKPNSSGKRSTGESCTPPAAPVSAPDAAVSAVVTTGQYVHGLPHPSVRTSYKQPLRKHKGRGRKMTSKSTVGAFGVRFAKTVSVTEIPSHSVCSKEEKQTLWSSRDEVRGRAQINYQEYRADGQDWRNCKEEEDMVLLKNGNYMHPYTYKCLKLADEVGSMDMDISTPSAA